MERILKAILTPIGVVAGIGALISSAILAGGLAAIIALLGGASIELTDIIGYIVGGSWFIIGAIALILAIVRHYKN